MPLIVAQSYGFIGSIRLQIDEHTIVETHPDDQKPDLRLDRPFPALVEYMDSINMDTMDLKDHAHVPFVVPLYKALIEWKRDHEGRLPMNYKEKEAFKNIIRKGNFINFVNVIILLSNKRKLFPITAFFASVMTLHPTFYTLHLLLTCCFQMTISTVEAPLRFIHSLSLIFQVSTT